MGSLELPCPLCCTETFACHNSLKYHLLSISDNLICPSCGDRFERIFDLAMHLGNKCLDPTPDSISTDSIETITPICIKVETDEDTNTVTNSILARALTKDKHQDETEISNKHDENVADDEEVYFCSSCNIHLTSIEDHIKKFHDGHEVYLEDNKCESIDDPENSIPIFITHETNSTENSAEKDQNAEEEFRQGSLVYTRKLVKIDKFWDNKIIEGGKVEESEEKVDDVEAVENDNVESDQVVTIVQIYECSKCSLPFTTEEQFDKHICKAEIKYCQLCDENFSNSKLLSIHMKTHKKEMSKAFSTNPPFICETCNTEFPSFKSLRLHRRMHEPTKAKNIEPPASYGLEGEEVKDAPREKFICVICCKEYDKEYAEAHKKFHSEEKDFNCEICNRKFLSQENLDMHMHAHSGTKKFVCSYCKKGFLTDEKLEAHMTTKCQMRQYECQYCGRRFSRPHEKVKHERIHTGEKPHKCEICGKTFRVSYCLTLHMRTHSGTRPYKCEHCGKRFKAHSVYNHHLLTHSEDRKYKCTYCPKTFKTGVQLAGHKNSHTKPFTCTDCNRPFASLYAVRSHMATHKRQNNLKYKCWLCGASYARSFALRDHIKEQHYDNVDGKENPSGQLESIDYVINETIEGDESMLRDGDENMLIDIADGQDVHDIVEVAIPPVLSDNN